MLITGHKSMFGAMLGLLLLAGGATSMFTVDVDNDSDEATPAISIQLQVAAPSEKNIPVERAPSKSCGKPAEKDESSSRSVVSRLSEITEPSIEYPPPLVVPLRT